MPNLGADLSAIINAELFLPRLALDVFTGLPGLSLPGLTLPGLPGLTLPGLPGLWLPNLGADIGAVINAELALPRLALDLFVTLPALTLQKLALSLSLGLVA